MARRESATRRKVRELTEQGLTPRQISLALGISTQAAYKHLNKIRVAQEPPIEQDAF